MSKTNFLPDTLVNVQGFQVSLEISAQLWPFGSVITIIDQSICGCCGVDFEMILFEYLKRDRTLKQGVTPKHKENSSAAGSGAIALPIGRVLGVC